jgi:hypothetical protein
MYEVKGMKQHEEKYNYSVHIQNIHYVIFLDKCMCCEIVNYNLLHDNHTRLFNSQQIKSYNSLNFHKLSLLVTSWLVGRLAADVQSTSSSLCRAPLWAHDQI